MCRLAKAQHGFSMIELMIALLISLFLLGALGTLVQDNKRTSIAQTQLAKLQDSQRLALSLMTDVIQTGGYFPDPTLNTAALTMPAITTPVMAAGQAFYGTYSATGTGDTLVVRYATAPSDNILSCTGTSNTTGATYLYYATFSVANGQLVCTRENGTTVLGTAYPLVGDVLTAPNPISITNLSVLYGINSTATSNNVDMYKNAGVMTAADWSNVISIQITLTFTNPLYIGPNQGQPQTIALSRIVGVMSQTGI
jgi:type IV pilus assembly protein PilW